MRIGIIGAESKHVEYFGKLINNDILFENARVDLIWGGDTSKERLRECVTDVGIEYIADTPSELIDRSDAVIITLRNGNHHAKYAIECLQKKKPVFIDKPFTCSIDDATSIIYEASMTNTPFTGGSTLCFLPEIDQLAGLANQSSLTTISYLADPDSPFGGWYFYGSHLTDLCAAICGTDATYVSAKRSGSEIFVDVFYPNKKVRIYSAPDITQPSVTMSDRYILNDEHCYYYGLKSFFKTIETGQSSNSDRLLFSVKLMDAIMTSLSSGKETAILY